MQDLERKNNNKKKRKKKKKKSVRLTRACANLFLSESCKGAIKKKKKKKMDMKNSKILVDGTMMVIPVEGRGGGIGGRGSEGGKRLVCFRVRFFEWSRNILPCREHEGR